MFYKSLILVLLTSTLILANPVQKNQEIQEIKIKRSILSTISEWLHKADKTISDAFDRVKQPFKKVYNAVIATGEGVAEYGKEKINQLLRKYYELKHKSQENVNNIKNAFLGKVINELQKILEILKKETNGETFEQLKEKTYQIAESGKAALEELEKQLQEAINAEKTKLEENLYHWQHDANSIIKN